MGSPKRAGVCSWWGAGCRCQGTSGRGWSGTPVPRRPRERSSDRPSKERGASTPPPSLRASTVLPCLCPPPFSPRGMRTRTWPSRRASPCSAVANASLRTIQKSSTQTNRVRRSSVRTRTSPGCWWASGALTGRAGSALCSSLSCSRSKGFPPTIPFREVSKIRLFKSATLFLRHVCVHLPGPASTHPKYIQPNVFTHTDAACPRAPPPAPPPAHAPRPPSGPSSP
jgi:hypothetical protein